MNGLFQVIRVILTSKLESLKIIHQRKSQDHDFNYTVMKSELFKYIDQNIILDSSGQYNVVPFLFRALMLGSSNLVKKDIGLVTQTSSSHALLIQDLSRRWDGLISVAVFSEYADLNAVIDRIILLIKCHPEVQLNTSIHLVFPLDQRVYDPATFQESINCGHIRNPQGHISYAVKQVAYPVNLLRNVARRYSMTEFIFVVDIDLIPSKSFRTQFLGFASKNNLFHESHFGEKAIYVVPAYEMSEYLIESGVPSDKNSLVAKIDRKEIRPFYSQVCWKCHKYTNYKSWETSPMGQSVEVIYEVSWQDPWEPFYVSRANVPLYDERFKRYGFNRISQVYELHVAGYKFLVLNNLFLIHRGLKDPESFHSSKDEDQERNRILFRQFKSDLHEKYSLDRQAS